MQVQSVSAWPEKRGEIKKMMQLAAEDIKRLGGEVELVDIGNQTVRVGYALRCPCLEKKLTRSHADWLSFCTQLPSGDVIPLPPIVLGRLGSDPGKKTVCIYGHLDVQPASIEDGWDTEPFNLVEKDGKRQRLFWFPFKANRFFLEVWNDFERK